MGGAELYLLRLLPELKKRNIEVGFFCTQQNNNREIINRFTSHFDKYDIPVYVCNATSLLSIKAAYKLAQTISKGNYNILSAHLMHAEIISALSKILFSTSCKLAVTKHGYLQNFMGLHGLDPFKINKANPSYLVEKFIQHFVTKNVAVSQGLADFYTISGICSPSKMDVIYHGLNTNFCEATYDGAKKLNKQILAVGRLKKFKGHRYLLEAVKLLCKELPNIHLVIVGEGEELGRLISMVNEYKLDQWVSFEGYKENVCEYIRDSDVIIVPSIAEPFGLIVLEAYSCSKPVVAFDVTALNENIINNETGYLVAPFDVASLATKIKLLLQNEEVARQFGANGFNLLKKKFSLEKCIDNTIAFFKSIQ